MGDFRGLSCTKSSRKPEYSPISAPGGRSDRCQGHRGLNGQPTVEADTFGLGIWHGEYTKAAQCPHRDALPA